MNLKKDNIQNIIKKLKNYDETQYLISILKELQSLAYEDLPYIKEVENVLSVVNDVLTFRASIYELEEQLNKYCKYLEDNCMCKVEAEFPLKALKKEDVQKELMKIIINLDEDDNCFENHGNDIYAFANSILEN